MEKDLRRMAGFWCDVEGNRANPGALAIEPPSEPDGDVDGKILALSAMCASDTGRVLLLGSELSLAANGEVNIRAAYSPANASADFGLVDENDVFHYSNVKAGSIDRTIRITEGGSYTLAIRNNSSAPIRVTGLVTYG